MHCACQMPSYFLTAQITRKVGRGWTSIFVLPNPWTAPYCNAIKIYAEHIRCRTLRDLRSVPHVDVMLSHECLDTLVLQVRLLTLPVLECNYSQTERAAAGTTPPFREVILSAGSIFRAQWEGVRGCQRICCYTVVNFSSSGASSMFSVQRLANEPRDLRRMIPIPYCVAIHYLFPLVRCNEGLYPPSSPFH